MMSVSVFACRGVAALAAGTFLAVTPVVIAFQPSEGFTVTVAKAFAKDGEDHGGSDDHGDDHGGGNGSSGSSGSGSSGSSGSSSGDDHGSDDHGGSSGSGNSGSSGGGSSNDDKASGGRGGADDSRDDHGGARGSDDASGDDHGGAQGASNDDRGDRRGGAGTVGAVSATQSGSGSGGLQVVKIERTATGIEVVYSNGIKEEISGGQYELKNPAGRTVKERPATQKDLARINANARASGIAPGAVFGGRGTTAVPSGSQAQKVEAGGNTIEVVYDTGWKEEIAFGRYELTDPNHNTVVERRATANDRSRLQALAGN